MTIIAVTHREALLEIADQNLNLPIQKHSVAETELLCST